MYDPSARIMLKLLRIERCLVKTKKISFDDKTKYLYNLNEAKL